MTFETERLFLRPFEREDTPLIHAIASDPETTKYLYYWGRIGITPEADTERFLHYALSTAWEYCLILKQTNEKIGDGSIEKLDDETAEIGWILLPAYRHQGYVHEMAERLMRYGFEEMGVQKIIAHCDGRNIPSQNVMKKLGMRFSGCEKKTRPEKKPGDKRGDEYTYAITKEEWLSFQGKDEE